MGFFSKENDIKRIENEISHLETELREWQEALNELNQRGGIPQPKKAREHQKALHDVKANIIRISNELQELNIILRNLTGGRVGVK